MTLSTTTISRDEDVETATYDDDEEPSLTGPANQYYSHDDDSIYHQQQPKLKIELRERLVHIRHSYIFTAYFLLIIPLCLFLFIYAVVKRGKIEEIWYVCLEGVATVLLYFEFFFNLAVEGIRKTIASIFAWLHVAALFACTAMFILLVVGMFRNTSKFREIWSGAAYVEDIILAIQCAINMSRILVYLYHTRKRRSIFRKKVLLDVPSRCGDKSATTEEKTNLLSPVKTTTSQPIQLTNSATSNHLQHCEDLCKLTQDHKPLYYSSFVDSPHHESHSHKSMLNVDSSSTSGEDEDDKTSDSD
jgi:hypothetical protein